jgi:hypothetical protein
VAFQNDPVGIITTAVLTVEAGVKVALYAGGGKVSEQSAAAGDDLTTGTVSVLRFGATVPSGLEPASLLIQEIRAWRAPLDEADAIQVSSNLGYMPTSGGGVLPVVSIPQALSVIEGQTLAIPVTKSNGGPCSVTIRTVALSAAPAEDYTAFQQTLTFAAGVGTQSAVLSTVGDTRSEMREDLAVELIQASGCTLGNALGIVTIIDPNAPANLFTNQFTNHFYGSVLSG